MATINNPTASSGVCCSRKVLDSGLIPLRTPQGRGIKPSPRIKKTCFDCLHCKVLAESTENFVLCFCAKAEKKVKHELLYWLTKKVCGDFDDMGGEQIPMSDEQFITNEKNIMGNKRRRLMAWRY